MPNQALHREMLKNRMLNATTYIGSTSQALHDIANAQFLAVLPEFLSEFVSGSISCDMNNDNGVMRIMIVPKR